MEQNIPTQKQGYPETVYPGADTILIERYLAGEPVFFCKKTGDAWTKVIPYSEPNDVWRVSNRYYTYCVKDTKKTVYLYINSELKATVYDSPNDKANLSLTFINGKLTLASIIRL